MSTLPALASVDQIPPHHFLYLATDSTEAKMYFGTGGHVPSELAAAKIGGGPSAAIRDAGEDPRWRR